DEQGRHLVRHVRQRGALLLRDIRSRDFAVGKRRRDYDRYAERQGCPTLEFDAANPPLAGLHLASAAAANVRRVRIGRREVLLCSLVGAERDEGVRAGWLIAKAELDLLAGRRSERPTVEVPPGGRLERLRVARVRRHTAL